MLVRVLSVASSIAVALFAPLQAQQPSAVALAATIRTDFIFVAGDTVNTSLTIQFNREDLQFRQRNGVTEALIYLTARITTADGRRVDRGVEEVLEVRGPAEQLATLRTGNILYNTIVPLLPGRYTLTVAARDVVGNRSANYDVDLNVPTFRVDALSTSSLILADVLEKVPARSTGNGQFVIGSSKVRPRIDETFKRGDSLGIYMEVHHFQTDAITQRPEGSVTYEIVRSGSNEIVLELTEDVSALNGGDSQLIIEKKLKLEAMTPGDYTLQIKVTDSKRNQTITPSASFRVI